MVGGRVMWLLKCEKQLVACLWRFWVGGVSGVAQGVELVRLPETLMQMQQHRAVCPLWYVRVVGVERKVWEVGIRCLSGCR